MSRWYHGFLDESGIIEKKNSKGKYFIIAVIIVANSGDLRQAMKFARRKAKKKFKMHTIFHAFKEDEGFIKLVLEELAKVDVDIFVSLWNKQSMSIPKGKHILYASLLGQTINVTLSYYSNLQIVVHKRYTLPSLQRQLSDYIGQNTDRTRNLQILQRSVAQQKELEFSDAVAWAVFQNYNQRRPQFYNLIKKKVKKESRLTA